MVITSVDRDDLRDGGAGHYVECIQKTRELSPGTQIEVLVPDFRGRLDKALDILAEGLPDVMNHNMETVPRLARRPPGRRLRALAQAAEGLQGPLPAYPDQERPDGRAGRDRRGNPRSDARHARTTSTC